MADVVREEGESVFGRAYVVERRKISWSAIVAGLVVTLALQIFMIVLGTALGVTVFQPLQATTALPIGAIIWFALTFIVPPFIGAWVAGRWANVLYSGDALLHGVATWALVTVVAVFTAGYAISPFGSHPEIAHMTGIERSLAQPLTYNSLQDQRFTSFLLQRARTWEPDAGQPVAVSAEEQERGELTGDQRKARDEQVSELADKDAASDADLKEFLVERANMTNDQADDFLSSQRTAIDSARAQGYQRFAQANAPALQQAERVRKTAMTVAWTLTGLTLLSLLAALGGAYLGWKGQYEPYEEERRPGMGLPPRTGVTE